MKKKGAESEFILVKGRLNEDCDVTNFSIERNNEKLDLKGLVYLETNDNGLEVWVHEEDYDYHYNKLHFGDELKMWNGSEDYKDFIKGLNV